MPGDTSTELNNQPMHGPRILVRTISKPLPKGSHNPQPWQYHPRSDHHSKVACWGIMFDFLQHCPLLVRHVSQKKVGFGINHTMPDFRNNRDKTLDLVVCTVGQGKRFRRYSNLLEMAEQLQIELSPEEQEKLSAFPELKVVRVGSVLVALEAKACMTAHQKAKPRLHDELNSSHLIVHGSTDTAISGGFAMVNLSTNFISPIRNPKPFSKPIVWNHDKQPESAQDVIRMIADIPRRSRVSEVGYDALSIVVVECVNEDSTPVRLVEELPAPAVGTTFHYSSMIHRLSHLYTTRFADL
jgi:hypothetical protein